MTPETIPITLRREWVLKDEVAYGTRTCVVLLSSDVIVAIRKILPVSWELSYRAIPDICYYQRLPCPQHSNGLDFFDPALNTHETFSILVTVKAPRIGTVRWATAGSKREIALGTIEVDARTSK
jgi:hypothetical protein